MVLVVGNMGNWRWKCLVGAILVFLMASSEVLAAALPKLDRDRWYAKTGSMLVKPGAEGTLMRDSIELPIEVASPKSICGRKARKFLDQLIQRGPRSLHQQGLLNDKIIGHPDRHNGPVLIDDEYLSLAMISNGFARALAGPCQREVGRCRRYQLAAERATREGLGCVNDASKWREMRTESEEVDRENLAGRISRNRPQLEVPSERQVYLEADQELPTGFQWSTYIRGLDDMTDFVFLNNGNMVVLLVNGIMMLVNNNRWVNRTPFLDFRDITSDFFDRGAMSVVKAPDYNESRSLLFFFTYEHDPRPEAYEAPKTARVVRVIVNARENRAIPHTMKVILGSATGDGCDLSLGQDCISVDARSHIGGGMTTAGGYLYIAVGDQARAWVNQGGNRAQQLGHYTGKILRVNPKSGRGLTSNPYYTPGMSLDDPNSKIYSLGVRSPFSLESTAGKEPVMVGDVQWETMEEVSPVIPGLNLGWPCWESNVYREDYLIFEECRNFANATRVIPLMAWNRKPGTSSAAVVGEHISPVGWPKMYQNVRVFGDIANKIMSFARVKSDGSLRRLVQSVMLPSSPIRFRMSPTNRTLFVLQFRHKQIMELRFDKFFQGIEVSETVPEDGESVPLVDAEFLVRFSVNPLPASARSKISLRSAEDGSVIDAEVQLDFVQRTMLLKSKVELTAGRTYNLWIANGEDGVTNLFGEPLRGNNVFSFTAAGTGSDTETPTVESFSPREGAYGVSVTHRFRVKFSEEIRLPIDYSLFTVELNQTRPSALPVALTNFAYDRISRTVSFSPLEPLLRTRRYHLIVSDRLVDDAGNAMAESFQSSFYTEFPDPNAIKGKIFTPQVQWMDRAAYARVNETLRFSGEMTTVDGVAVPPEHINFQFSVNHCAEGGIGCHQHDVLSVKGDALVPVTLPEHTGSFYYMLTMSASFDGYSGMLQRRINVVTTNVRFESSPTGIEVGVNGVTRTTPFTLALAFGGRNDIFAPATGRNGVQFKLWRFSSSEEDAEVRKFWKAGLQYTAETESGATWKAIYGA